MISDLLTPPFTPLSPTQAGITTPREPISTKQSNTVMSISRIIEIRCEERGGCRRRLESGSIEAATLILNKSWEFIM